MEKEIRRIAVNRLRKLGWTVDCTSSNQATSVTRGTADLILMKPTLSGFAILVDAKSSRGRLSPEQEFRRQNGFVAYLKSPDEIVEYALRKEREFLALKRKQPR